MFPTVDEAFADMTETVQFAVVGKTNADFETVETINVVIKFQGHLQPADPSRVLQIKQEGQRRWKHWEMWSKTTLQLDWVVQDNEGRQFRVLESEDWHRGGYRQYLLVENPDL